MATAADCTTVSAGLAKLCLARALDAEARGATEAARTHFLEAVERDPSPAASLEFGRFLDEWGQFGDAVLIVQDAWQLAKRRGRADEVAACCRRLASLWMAAGDGSQSRRFAQRAAAAEMSGWSIEGASFSDEQLLLESQLAMIDGEIPVAVQLGQAALQMSRGALRAAVLRHLARLSMLEGSKGDAARRLVAAARHARAYQSPWQYGECLLELGHVLKSMGRGRLAIRCYRAAESRLQSAGKGAAARQARRWLRETSAVERCAGQAEWN